MFDSYLLMQFEYHYFISKYTYFFISSQKHSSSNAKKTAAVCFFLFNITIILHFAAEFNNSETKQ